MAYTLEITLGLPTDYFGQANNINFNLRTALGVITGPFNNSTTPGMINELSAGVEDEATFQVSLSIPNGFSGRVLFYDSNTNVLLRVVTINPADEDMNSRADGVESGWTWQQIMRLMAAAILGKASNNGATFRDVNDTKNRITAVVDSNGNRTVVTKDAT